MSINAAALNISANSAREIYCMHWENIDIYLWKKIWEYNIDIMSNLLGNHSLLWYHFHFFMKKFHSLPLHKTINIYTFKNLSTMVLLDLHLTSSCLILYRIKCSLNSLFNCVLDRVYGNLVGNPLYLEYLYHN